MNDTEPIKKLVLSTRQIEGNYKLSAELKTIGLELLEDPAISINLFTIDFDQIVQLRTDYTLVFTSANGVRALSYCFEILAHQDRVRQFASNCSEVYCIGEATAAEFELFTQKSLLFKPCNRVIGDGTPQSLLSKLDQRANRDISIVHIGGVMVKPKFGDMVAKLGYDYQLLVAYEALANHSLLVQTYDAFAKNILLAQLVYSKYSLEAHVARCNKVNAAWQEIPMICLSEPIANLANAMGHKKIYCASEVNQRSVINELKKIAKT